jgi:putative ABC transport system permease protein
MRELRYALRRLRGSPMFTTGATLTLAIAIGATASVFSLVDGVLLKAFPYRSPDRVLTIWESNPARQRPQATVATQTFFDFQQQNRSFSALAASCCGPVQMTVTWPHEAEQVPAIVVTGDYFKVLGITPILGRPLSPDTTISEVVISYDYWQRRFGGLWSVIGRTILLDNGNDQRPTPRHTYTIVGVMPPGLAGPVDLWTPIFFEPIEANDYEDRYLNVYGRLKPNVTPEAAQHDLETIAARLAVAYPKTNAQWSVVTVPLLDVLVGPVRPALLALLAAAGCVLLIGAATLANLFLVRCLARQREIAVRVALGAAPGRLARELAVEAAALALGAGAIGVGVAVLGASALRRLAPATLPRLSEIGVDARVVAFCALASIATAFVFGLLPAWAASRTNLAEFLKEGGRGTGSAQRNRLQQALVVMQVAVAVVLLTGAGLLVASFEHFESMDPGFRSTGVLTAQIALSPARYPTPEQAAGFFASVEDRLATQPGVEAATVAYTLPGGGTSGAPPFTIVGDPALDPVHQPTANRTVVGPGYFRTMGITLERGRTLLPTDDRRAVSVAVIDELLARRYFGVHDPIGRQVRFGVIGNDTLTLDIVGVVRSVKQFGLGAETVPQIYMPFAQRLDKAWVKDGVNAYVAVRTKGDAEAQTKTLENVLANLDPMVPVYHFETLSERTAKSVGTTRFSSFLASLFAIVALILGSIGIYSVLAYIVGQQQREIAVRVALGARGSHVMGGVVRRALALSGIGIAIGSAVAWMLTRALAGLFLGVSPHDPGIFAGAAAVFLAVALVAASVPALRTTRVNPVLALNST